MMHRLYASEVPVETYYTLFCLVYVLNSRLLSSVSASPQQWEPRSRIGVYLDCSSFDTSSDALVFNPLPGRVGPQYHVLFDNEVSTVCTIHSFWNCTTKLGRPPWALQGILYQSKLQIVRNLVEWAGRSNNSYSTIERCTHRTVCCGW